jgi:ATP:corrinoid adenosyltransferase
LLQCDRAVALARSLYFQVRFVGRKGRILVFTGAGKGKTTRALGWGLQAVTRGLNVYSN